MTNTKIIEMAREAGLAPICEGCDVPNVSYAYESWDEELKAFEALVRADEREACAKVCVKIALEFKSMYCGDEMEAALICEENIRARGNT